MFINSIDIPDSGGNTEKSEQKLKKEGKEQLKYFMGKTGSDFHRTFSCNELYDPFRMLAGEIGILPEDVEVILAFLKGRRENREIEPEHVKD